jgi:hypothetical protein
MIAGAGPRGDTGRNEEMAAGAARIEGGIEIAIKLGCEAG